MKNILLHIHDDDDQAGRLEVALHLAAQCGGRLACVQVTPLEPYASDPYGGLFGMSALIDTIHSNDKALRIATESRLSAAGVAWQWYSFDGNVVETLIDQAMLADIVVLSQSASPLRRLARQPLAIVGDVVMYTRCPVLVVPHGAQCMPLSAPVVVAWNGSAESAHGLRLALPLLKQASAVHVVEVNDDQTGDQPGPAARQAAQWLSWHGIAADVHDWPAKGRRVSVALLHAVAELSAAYLVMGAYGHSRLRETVLGGVTRELIATTNVPLLLAH